MIDIDTIVIDNITYIVIGKKNGYVYLANKDNPKDFMIKKEITKDNENYLIPIESREEFDKALQSFIN